MECSKGESHKMKEENNQNLEGKIRLSVRKRLVNGLIGLTYLPVGVGLFGLLFSPFYSEYPEKIRESLEESLGRGGPMLLAPLVIACGWGGAELVERGAEYLTSAIKGEYNTSHLPDPVGTGCMHDNDNPYV